MAIPRDVTYGSEQLREWLVELRDRALLGSSTHAYAMLRAVLLEIRDRSDLPGALRIADALPPLVRGIMLEGWHPCGRGLPPEPRPAFLDAVKARVEPHSPPPDGIVEDALVVMARHLYPQYWPVVAQHLPEELRDAWRAAVEAQRGQPSHAP